MSNSKLDHRIASAEGRQQAVERLLEKSERKIQRLEAENASLSARVTQAETRLAMVVDVLEMSDDDAGDSNEWADVRRISLIRPIVIDDRESAVKGDAKLSGNSVDGNEASNG